MRPGTSILLLALFLFALPACPENHPVVDEAALKSRIAELEEENAELETRVAKLEEQLAAVEQTTVVKTGEGSFELRLNAATAVVISVAVIGAVILLVVWMRLRFAPQPPSSEEAYSE